VIGGQFELAVALNDFANDVGQVQTNFTHALAVAFDADPANVTLVYYDTHAADSPPRQRRLLLQTSAEAAPALPPATTVESKVNVFASIPRISTAVSLARLKASVPGIKIQLLRTVPVITTQAPTTTALPGTSPVMTAKDDTATDTKFELYAAGAGGALLLILVGAVVLVVVLRRRSTQANDYYDYDDDDPSNYEEDIDMGQTMASTDFRPQNMQNAVLPAQYGGLYNSHDYKTCNSTTYR